MSKINKQPNHKMGRRLKQTLSKENIQMAIKHVKRWSTYLIIREMHIKTTAGKIKKKKAKIYSEVSPHTSQNDHHKKSTNNKY